jgi:glycosyltransferase involved in cell wall biosynthesis
MTLAQHRHVVEHPHAGLRCDGIRHDRHDTYRVSLAYDTIRKVAERHEPLTKQRSHRGSRRLRVALVGPLPSVASGIAGYNLRIANELAARVELDFLRTGGDPPAQLDRAWRSLPAGALGQTVDPTSYDAILYTVGNSHHHIETRRLALRHPGVVWFHDVRLTGLYRDIAERDRPEDAHAWMRSLIRAQYGGRLAGDLGGAPVLKQAWWDRYGVFLSGELARRARAVVVNSSAGERILVDDQRPDRRLPPLLRLDHAISSDGDPRVPRATDPPLVATFGLVDWIKAPDRLLEAVARVAPATGARAALVGSVAHVGLARLEAVASALGIADRVELTGFVDDARWWRMLRTATVAVQLRRVSNGEASGAIACAQAVGTPVITNGAMASDDYPADAVLPIGQDLRPGELEAALRRLLCDVDEWKRFSLGALAHAQRCTFAAVADRLAKFLEHLAASRPAPRSA